MLSQWALMLTRSVQACQTTVTALDKDDTNIKVYCIIYPAEDDLLHSPLSKNHELISTFYFIATQVLLYSSNSLIHITIITGLLSVLLTKLKVNSHTLKETS